MNYKLARTWFLEHFALGGEIHEEALKKGLEAIEKQIPKKPIMKQCFDDLDEQYLCCPSCGEILTDRIPFNNKEFYFHCLNCGQKFDWSDND